ncbi:uncharacterized protein LOC123559470 [Mercenaria mercenaria]|uniref:uncharacterized protein LOC123559470 n=1 Tax=Mercenaria mercenaria TaxID=6596 RepID=UPI00234EB878|nr:uncharacterized protein LOC123559470 [Mercenaria mercenaria]
MHSSYYPWKNATQKCYKLNGYATRYVNTTFNFQELPRGSLWTGVIRSNAIYKYDEIDIKTFSKIECGYTVLSQSDQKDVMFTDNCNSALREVLCRYETTSTVTTFPTYMANSELTGSDSSTKTDKTTLSSNISSGNWSGTDINEQEIQYKDSDFGAIIGSSVASILVVIAAAAVIAIILKRRHNNQSEHQTKMGNLSEQANYITPISTEADDRIYINVRDNDTGETNDCHETPNPHRNVYEYLQGRSNEDHFYETTNSSLK